MITRRKALVGLFVAPAIIRTPGLLMPIKPLQNEYEAWVALYAGTFGVGFYPAEAKHYPISVWLHNTEFVANSDSDVRVLYDLSLWRWSFSHLAKGGLLVQKPDT